MSNQANLAGKANAPVAPFVAVDWGTSSFRLWHVAGNGDIVGSQLGSEGMANLQSSEYSAVLERYLENLAVPLERPVVICGMAGAAQGWYEAPYMPVSNSLFSLGLNAIRIPKINRRVYILPGVMQSDPANVMRGEETQLLGFLTNQSDYSGVVCLPGTHTKWATVRAGNIKQFTTCMTGELFSLMSKQSVLKFSVDTLAWDSAAFDAAITETMQAPISMSENLFRLRASTLLHNQKASISRARLSGLLIGFELASMRSYWEQHNVVLIGDSSLCQYYSKALMQHHVRVQSLDSQKLTLDGLVHAFNQIETASDAT